MIDTLDLGGRGDPPTPTTTGTGTTEASAWWNRWRPAWHADAACAGNPVSTFFPGRGEPTEPAVTICATCPVAAACMAEALADPTLCGIWGGTSATARRQMRQRSTVSGNPGDATP